MRPEDLRRTAPPAALASAALLIAACGGVAPRAAAAPPASAAPVTAPPAAVVAPVPAEDDAGVPIGPGDPTWGRRTAGVTIVEFADFECPYCARAEPILAHVREVYGPDDVRIVWKHCPLPFHAGARPAAEASEGVRLLAGDEAFWRFASAAFASQDSGSDAGAVEDRYAAWARQAGVQDVGALMAGLRSHAWAAKVDADMAEARRIGVMGTPTFFVNGIRVVGAQPFESLRTVIDAQLAVARARIAAGMPRERLYAVLSRENFAAQPADDDEDDDHEDGKTVYAVPVGASPARGAAGAPVTIVEFADYQCPFCMRAEAVLRDLRAEYGDKLRLVFRNEPLTFHPGAEPAAEAALEVRAEKGDDAFWAMHDALLDGSHRDLGAGALADLASTFGARPDKVRAAIDKHAHRAEIEADEDCASDFGVSGTPHFFINGRRLLGAQPKEAFVAVIEEELKKAQALLDAGTKPAALYDALTKDGAGPPEPPKADTAALPAGDPARGPAGARVTIHEFADFQCPFCARAEGTLKELAHRYGDRVRFVWHDLPLSFHADALAAARAAREARRQRGDAAFWALHDRFFAQGAKLGRESLDAGARALKLDMKKGAAALDGDAHQAQIDADQAAADKLGFAGTPSFLVVPAGAKSGYVVVGAQGAAAFRKVIERALAEAGR